MSTSEGNVVEITAPSYGLLWIVISILMVVMLTLASRNGWTFQPDNQPQPIDQTQWLPES